MKTSDSLQDFAYEEIKKRIQNGEYAPGTKLNTQEISDSLGISRSPVLAGNQPFDCAWSGRSNAEKGHNRCTAFRYPD